MPKKACSSAKNLKINILYILNKYFLALTLLLSTVIYKSQGAATTTADTTKRKAKPATIFPVLPANINRLFYVQRDPNPNTIVYELNLNPKGELNTEEPIHPYWIRYNDKGQHEDLNYIQRKFAYGLVQKPMGNGKFDIRFVSYKKFQLILMKGTDAKYHIYTTIARKEAILNRIFVKIEGGSFWIPNVVYIELRGTDPATGQEKVDRFKP